VKELSDIVESLVLNISKYNPMYVFTESKVQPANISKRLDCLELTFFQSNRKFGLFILEALKTLKNHLKVIFSAAF